MIRAGFPDLWSSGLRVENDKLVLKRLLDIQRHAPKRSVGRFQLDELLPVSEHLAAAGDSQGLVLADSGTRNGEGHIAGTLWRGLLSFEYHIGEGFGPERGILGTVLPAVTDFKGAGH